MLAAIIAIVAVIADQVTKYIVVQNMPNEHDAIPFINGFMRFERIHNEGGGWSILNGGGWERITLLGISLFAMALVIYVMVQFNKRHLLLDISLAMVLGGAVGNMIDRFRLKYVVDFLYTEFIDFPTFNIADCFITVGAILLLVYVIFFDAKVEKRIQAEKAAKEANEVPCEALPQNEDTRENE